jgi:hypothetical protein
MKTINEIRPEYFQPTTPVETILRQIKGNTRRAIVTAAVEQDGIDTIPEPWLAHELSEDLKSTLGGQRPNFRGGEDLPDLLEAEIEIARVTLVNSVHGEVTSLRARKDRDGKTILLRIVDEYGEGQYVDEEDETKYVLEQESFPQPLTAEETLYVFRNSESCACLSSCEQRFSSDFYPDLDELADKLDIKQVWEG